MKSIVNKESNAELLARIENLSPQTQALWGKMNVAQMLAHCTVGLKIAFGEIIPKSNFLFKIMGKIFKKKILRRIALRKILLLQKNLLSSVTENSTWRNPF